MIMVRILFSLLILFSTGAAEQRKYSGPRCLGSFCVNANVPSSRLFEQLGKPAEGKDVFCYRSQDGRTFLYLKTFHSEPDTVAEVFLSDFPNCMHLPVRTTTKDLRTWKTPEGIGLGSSEKTVLRAYRAPYESTMIKDEEDPYRGRIPGSKPNERGPQMGDKNSFYTSYTGDPSKPPEDNKAAEFGFRNGKVSWIWLSVNE
jgi:hypothetical protein